MLRIASLGPALRSQTYLAVLRAAPRVMTCLARWLACEVLPWPRALSHDHIVASACRVVGCGVSLCILSVTLRMSASAHGQEWALLWVGSVLTALLIGNVARELMIEMCATVATVMGHAFRRAGVTLGGRAFLEVHFPTRTWVRCESAGGEFSCEWTEPSGRCSRIDIQLRANSGPGADGLPAVVRVITAPRMTAA